MKEVKDSPTLRAELTVVSGDTERQIAIQKSQAPFFFRIVCGSLIGKLQDNSLF